MTLHPNDNIEDEPRVVELPPTPKVSRHQRARRVRSQPVKSQVVKESATPPPEPVKPTETNTQTQELTVIQACQLVGAYYKRDFTDLQFVSPMQFTDGAVVDFVDNGSTIATARLRLKNHMTVDNKSGAILITAYLTDLAFKREGLSVVVRNTK